MRPSYISQKQWWKYNLLFLLEHFIGVNNSQKYLSKSWQSLIHDIQSNENICERGKTIQIKECNSLDEFLSNRTTLNRIPLVFRGAAKDWESVKNWNRGYFREFFGDKEVALINNVGLAEKENQDKYIKTDFANFLDNLSKDKSNYLRFSRIIDDFPELRSQMDVEYLRKFKTGLSWGDNLYMFMGEGGTKTSMHSSLIESLFIQIEGRKRWSLYQARERIFLGARAGRMPYFYTDANPNDYEDPRYPLLKHAIKYEVILEPGDVLYFPAYYWHYVDNPTQNIGVTYKFTNIPKAFTESKLQTVLYFLATKPTLLRSFYHNIVHKRDFIFDTKQ